MEWLVVNWYWFVPTYLFFGCLTVAGTGMFVDEDFLARYDIEWSRSTWIIMAIIVVVLWVVI